MNRLVGIQVITCFNVWWSNVVQYASMMLIMVSLSNLVPMNGSKQKKIVKLLEPVQRVTKELSAKEASISQGIPFLETLQIELSTPRERVIQGLKPLKKRCLYL